jgi:hypothetical protein
MTVPQTHAAAANVHSTVQAVSRCVVIANGRAHLPQKEFERFKADLRATAPADRKELAAQLVALALTVYDTVHEAADSFLVQMAELTNVLLVDLRSIHEAFAKGGVDLRAAARRLGIDTAPRVAGKAQAPANASPFLQFMAAELRRV